MTAIRIVEGKATEKITVLQGSKQADTVMLVTELPWQEGFLGKVGTNFREQEVPVENYLGRAAAIWTIGVDFTQEAGEIAFTLTLTEDEMTYQATGMLCVEAVTAAEPTEKLSLFSVEEEERMTVDGATRKVTVPEALSTIGVEKDNNAKRIYFLCPRYFDGHDLSTCTRHYVNYLNLNEMGAEAGQYPIDDVTVEGENMTFSWLVSNHVTQKPGKVAFILCFKEVNEEGEVTWEWNTEYNDQLTVLQGLEPGDAVAEQYPDVLEQWLSKMENAAKGITFTPTLSEEGVLSWNNDGDLENPAPVDLKGPQGEKGDPGDSAQVDNTLTIEGEAADAKATGDALKGKMSFTGGKMTGSIDMSGNKIANLGAPTEDGDAVPKNYVDSSFAPAIDSISHPNCYSRYVDGEREWINPPMVAGEEYRTIERYNGKVVYVKLVDCGICPVGATSINHGLAIYNYKVISSKSNTAFFYGNSPGENEFDYWIIVSNYEIRIYRKTASTSNVFVAVYYTKD